MFDPETITIARAALGVISTAWLRNQDAHPTLVYKFDHEFDGPVELTRANLLRMASIEFNFDWLVDRILAAPARKSFRQATVFARRSIRDGSSYPLAARRLFYRTSATALADLLGLPDVESEKEVG